MLNFVYIDWDALIRESQIFHSHWLIHVGFMRDAHLIFSLNSFKKKANIVNISGIFEFAANILENHVDGNLHKCRCDYCTVLGWVSF